MNDKTGFDTEGGFIEVVGGFITGHGDGCTDGFGEG